MPLDGHIYLVNQGWSGKGTALRKGAISRPLAIPQKKTLAGLGKDRDEAFPFWDHLFSAAAKSIQLKCLSDEEDSGDSTGQALVLKRTSTGILSNRRPVEGTPATSGSSTPTPETDTLVPKRSLLATAKRDAAKRNLYSRFFRGPVLGPESLAKEEKRLALPASQSTNEGASDFQTVGVKEHSDVETKKGHAIVEWERSVSEKRKMGGDTPTEDDGARRERKQRKREERRRKKVEEEEKAARKARRKEKKSKAQLGKTETAGENVGGTADVTGELGEPQNTTLKVSTKKARASCDDDSAQREIVEVVRKKRKRRREE